VSKDKGWRPCGDYRELNALTIPERYPSVISMTPPTSYSVVPFHSEDIQKTVITTPFGLFEFPFMSFGLRKAAQTFQRFMDYILLGQDFCFTILGRHHLFSRSLEEYEQHLRALFNQLQRYGTLINTAK
jgi:hypothetical protein